MFYLFEASPQLLAHCFYLPDKLYFVDFGFGADWGKGTY